MTSFAQRITTVEQRINGLRDQLNEHWSKTDETNVSDEQLGVAGGLNERIAQEERTLAALRDSERHLAVASDDGNGRDSGRSLVPARTAQSITVASTPVHPTARMPFSLPAAKKLTPIDHWCAPALCSCSRIVIACRCQQKMNEIYGDDEATRAGARMVAARCLHGRDDDAGRLGRCARADAVHRLHGSAVPEGVSIRGWRPRVCR